MKCAAVYLIFLNDLSVGLRSKELGNQLLLARKKNLSACVAKIQISCSSVA